MEDNKEKSQEEMVKEAVEEAKKTAEATKEEAAEDEAKEAETEDSKESDTEEKKSGKKLFGKKDKKDKKDEKIEELTDRLTRQMAEFDNFRKRTKDIIEKILPVVDNFERGLDAVKEEDKEDPFIQGMEKVYKQLMTTLEGIEVKPIEAVGQEFDPNLHNAVMHVEDEEAGENIITEEFQKGYMYHDSVVRHSMVKVAN